MVMTTFLSCALLAFSVVHGQTLHNITVDDTDSSITYKGTWNSNTGETDAFGRGHRSSTEGGATATFSFTGVAVYYFMPLFENYTGTLLTLDSGPAQLVNLTRVANESTRSGVRWSATGLSNGKHTLVSSFGTSPKGEVANSGQVDGFIYTLSNPGTRDFTISCDDPSITYSPRGVWTDSAANLPSCAISKGGVRITSSPNATFTYDFTGDSVFVRTINTPKGGKISLSVNGETPQIYSTYANTTGCGSSQPQKGVMVRARGLGILRARSYTNTLTVKNVDGETQVDGITDGLSRPNAAHRTIFMDGKFCAGSVFFISYLLYSGIL